MARHYMDLYARKLTLSHDVASWSDITPCNKIDKPLVFTDLISILPKNHSGPVEKLISDFFRIPTKFGAIDSL